MRHKYLKKAKKTLSDYYTYYKHDNILVISEDKAVLPFAYLIVDEHYPENILLSTAVDYPHLNKAIDVALSVNSIKKIALTEQFFIAQNGSTYFGNDAYKYHEIESQISLEELEPFSDISH